MKEGKRWETTPMDIAMQISRNLAEFALISSVNDVLWDMSRPLEDDCSLEFYQFDSDEGRDTFWRSSAHILDQFLEQEYGCKLCIAPCTTIEEVQGFYYDAFYGDLGLSEKHFPNIEAGAAKVTQEKQPFERIEVSKDEALEMFSDNNFKHIPELWRMLEEKLGTEKLKCVLSTVAQERHSLLHHLVWEVTTIKKPEKTLLIV